MEELRTDLLNGRKFQVWEFTTSHSHLLIRSPQNSYEKTNVDVIFIMVNYMELPHILGEIELVEPTAEEIDRVANRVDELYFESSYNLYVISSKGADLGIRRYPILALHALIDENRLGYAASMQDVIDHITG